MSAVHILPQDEAAALFAKIQDPLHPDGRQAVENELDRLADSIEKIDRAVERERKHLTTIRRDGSNTAHYNATVASINGSVEKQRRLRAVHESLRLLLCGAIDAAATATGAASKSDRPISKAATARKSAAQTMAAACVQGVKEYVDAALKPLQERIAELERNLTKAVQLPYRGVYRQGDHYARGEFVTWGGSMWCANRAANGTPGEGNSDWVLAVKRGADARGAK